MRAPLPCTSKAYLLLMHLPWSRCSSVHFAAHPWPLVAWIVFWSSILYSLLHSRVGPCLIVRFSLFSPLFAPSVILLPFLPCDSTIPIVVLFDPCLLGLFWTCCILFFHLITMTQHCHWVCIHATWVSSIHSIAYGLPRPIFFPWSSLAHSNSTFSWAFACSFGLPLLNYHILYLWGSWAFHQLLTYFITLDLPRPILAFILPMSLLLLSLGSFRPACFLRDPFIILWAFDPSLLPFRLNDFFS